MRPGRRERMPCGCKAGRPRLDCVPCQAVRLFGEAIERARRDIAREMTPLPDWYMRDLIPVLEHEKERSDEKGARNG